MTTPIAATWTDAQPLTFTIVSNSTTQLTLHFGVTGLADVTFMVGRLAVTADVDRTSTPAAAHYDESGTVTVTQQQIVPDLGVETALTLTPGASTTQALRFDVTSAWAPGSTTSICANAVLSSGTVDNNLVLSELLAEAVGGDGVVCVFDDGANDVLHVVVQRDGTAPADQRSFLPNPSYDFALAIDVNVGDVYDGVTFHQSALDAATAASGTFLHQIIDLGSNDTLVSTSGTLAPGLVQLSAAAP